LKDKLLPSSALAPKSVPKSNAEKADLGRQTTIDQNQRSSASNARGGILIDAANRLAVVEQYWRSSSTGDDDSPVVRMVSGISAACGRVCGPAARSGLTTSIR
jgi:hypothetical protein